MSAAAKKASDTVFMRNSDLVWYRRLAEVPGEIYAGDPTIDRASLKGASAVARVHVWEYDDNRHESLEWFDSESEAEGDNNWSTSSAPCSSWETKRRRGESEARTRLRQVREALELPGTVRNYHFAIIGHLDTLWGERFADPTLLAEIESLCWIDVRLIEAHPDALRNEYRSQQRSSDSEEDMTEDVTFNHEFYNTPTFHRLVQLYEREGYLHEALEVIRRAIPFGAASEEDVLHLEERLSAIAREVPLAEGSIPS